MNSPQNTHRQPRPPFRKKRGNPKLEFVLGLLIGLCTPLFAWAVLREYYPQLQYEISLTHSDRMFMWTRVLMFAVIMNAGLFFGALRLDKEGISKGILIACLICVAASAYLYLQTN